MGSARSRMFALGVVVLAIAGTVAIAQQPRKTWKEYLGGPDSSHYSALNQINRENVNQIEIAWTYDTQDDLLYPFSPLVVDSVAYLAAKKGSLVAVDATSGKELWVHEFPAPDAGTVRFGRGGISGQRGVNYWESKDRSDRRILLSANGSLQAIDARTGRLTDSFGDHGKVDLRIGIDRPSRPLSSRTPGRVFEKLIILGSATGEGYLAPPGDLRAFDVLTGKLVWVFHTIPRPGELGYDTWPKDAYKYMGGLDTWGEITVDEKRGIVYFPVASPKYELYGGDRPGNNLFGDCLIAADARTGKYLWHYQTVHHDIWDYDPTAAPQLVTVQHEGKSVDAVALASKNGFLFVFDRVTGKPLWPIEERPVPKSSVPGEVTSPTQPFPTAPPPFARQKITEDDVFPGFMTPEEFASWKKRIAEAPKGFYTPPGLVDTVSVPGVNGGALYFDTMSDPTTGVVYVKSKDAPSLFLKLVPEGAPLGNSGTSVPASPPEAIARAAAKSGRFTEAQRGRAFYDQNCAVCHRTDARGDRGPALDTVVQRLGPGATRDIILKGRGGMPPFSSLGPHEVNALIEFLRNPAAVPPGSVPAAAATAAFFRPVEPPYPPDVPPPPSRYKTGYGTEEYITTPPWTTITAIDLNTAEIKWQVPYGDTPEAGPSNGQMRGNGFPRSGPVITAGGLIFYAGNDSKLYVIDKDTGKLLCTKDLPNGSQGVPAVYEAGGREYVLITVTGGTEFPEGARLPPGGVRPPATARQYIAFALPQTNRTNTR